MTRGYTNQYYGVTLRGGQSQWLDDPARFTPSVQAVTDQLGSVPHLLLRDEHTGKKYSLKMTFSPLLGPTDYLVVVRDESRPGFYVLHGNAYGQGTTWRAGAPVALSREAASDLYHTPLTTWAEVEADPIQWKSTDMSLWLLRNRTQLFLMNVRTATLVAHEKIEFNNAALVVQSLNEKLGDACPGWYLKLDWLYELSGEVAGYYGNNVLTLCLFFGNKCVSSVQLETGLMHSALEMASFTLPDMEGRKFNRFLRACVILIASELTMDGSPVKVLHSTAVNKVSAHLIMTHYDVYMDVDFKSYLKKLQAQKKDNTVTMELLDEYMKDHYMNFDIDIEDNMENALKEVDTLTTGDARLRCRDAFASAEGAEEERSPKRARR